MPGEKAFSSSSTLSARLTLSSMPRNLRHELGRPPLLDATDAPYGEGDDPGEDEDAGYRHADGVEVKAGQEIPRLAAQSEVVGQHRGQLDGADREGDYNRQPRDGDVVEDLADRLRERPAVGEVHERSVDRVQ